MGTRIQTLGPKVFTALFIDVEGLEWWVVGLSTVLGRVSDDYFEKFVVKPGIETISYEGKGLQNIPTGKVEGTGDVKIGKGRTDSGVRDSPSHSQRGQ